LNEWKGVVHAIEGDAMLNGSGVRLGAAKLPHFHRLHHLHHFYTKRESHHVRCRGAPAIETSILIVAVGAIAALVWLIMARRAPKQGPQSPRANVARAAAPTKPSAPQIPYSTEATEAADTEVYKLAFGVARIDYQVLGEHAGVLKGIADAIEHSVHQRDYFPRRPMLLPKLMQALNDPEVPRETLVKLILEDPSIAGGVLQQANSAFYRVSPARVDSIDRAVWLLGTEGLRRLMATAIMQPVFRLPKGYFDLFAPVTWEQAQRAAAVAEAYAKHIAPCDAFVAQLLAVLEPLARIVTFRVVMERYRDTPNVMPRAEVFIRAMQQHGPEVALRIARAWEMSDASLGALEEHAEQRSPTQMRDLARAVYFARLASAMAMVATRDSTSNDDDAVAVLSAQGLDKAHARLLWVAAVSSHEASV
jgi:HD-like signal output (HDOD) protein